MSSQHHEPDHVSPLEYRYLPEGDPASEKVREYLAERAGFRYMLKVEAALAHCLSELGICSAPVAAEIEAASKEVTPNDIKSKEGETRHQIRAVVECIRDRIGPDAKPYVHLFATSSDIIDTANSLRYREFCSKVLIPNLVALGQTLATLATDHADTTQIGRTHGKFAEPVTFGFAVAFHLDRLTTQLEHLATAASALRGKLSGSVGAYNAASLRLDSPENLERCFLDKLGLPTKDQPVTSQIVPPEPITNLVYYTTSVFSILANIADDVRHLYRSEIGELSEPAADDRVGSSVMPHKANPIDFENVKSLWKAFLPRMMTVMMDQISEHQRDLTNSASARFTPEILAALDYAARRLTSSLQGLEIESSRMAENLANASTEITSEALQTLLALAGRVDAYETVRALAKDARKDGRNLLELASGVADISSVLEDQPDFIRSQLENPETYVGKAPDIARNTTKTNRVRLEQISQMTMRR